MPPTWIGTSDAARTIGVSRTTLDAMVARAPANLPGAPVVVGVGSSRRHLRWDAARLPEWLNAYRDWTAGS